jgi:hypothetical protein
MRATGKAGACREISGLKREVPAALDPWDGSRPIGSDSTDSSDGIATISSALSTVSPTSILCDESAAREPCEGMRVMGGGTSAIWHVEKPSSPLSVVTAFCTSRKSLGTPFGRNFSKDTLGGRGLDATHTASGRTACELCAIMHKSSQVKSSRARGQRKRAVTSLISTSGKMLKVTCRAREDTEGRDGCRLIPVTSL